VIRTLKPSDSVKQIISARRRRNMLPGEHRKLSSSPITCWPCPTIASRENNAVVVVHHTACTTVAPEEFLDRGARTDKK